jgi:ferritin-like metal-binding protein YciE
MAVMLERWNDDKMDALDAKVGRVEADVVKLDTKLDEHRKETKAGFERMDEKFERMDLKFERIQRTLFLASVTVIAVLIAALTSHP